MGFHPRRTGRAARTRAASRSAAVLATPAPEPASFAAMCSPTVVVECPPHACRPLSAASIRRVHFAVRGVLSAAERWGWIARNPAEVARKPRQPTPEPEPPTVAQAARIIDAAWAQDDDWGTLVWLVMVTGMRRAELLALRWSDVDLETGVVKVRRNYIRANRKSIEKDTKDAPDAPGIARRRNGRGPQ